MAVLAMGMTLAFSPTRIPQIKSMYPRKPLTLVAPFHLATLIATVRYSKYPAVEEYRKQ
jgi:hypothetical protein